MPIYPPHPSKKEEESEKREKSGGIKRKKNEWTSCQQIKL